MNSSGEQQQPSRGIRTCGRADQTYALFDDGKTGATDSIRAEPAIVDVVAFHEKVRVPGRASQPPNLRPKATPVDRLVEVEDCLALDQDSTAEVVVPGRQACHLNRQTQRYQGLWDPRPRLSVVGHDRADFTGWTKAAHLTIVDAHGCL